MLTRIVKVNPEAPDESTLREAVKRLNQGNPIAFPTETVYGLGVSARSPKGIEAIYSIKGRSKEKPLQLMISNLEMLKKIVRSIPESAYPLIEKYWPGPLTIIFRANAAFSASSGLATVAVRFPNHPVPLAIIERLGNPMAATSANLSGNLSVRNAGDVVRQLDGKIPLILDGGSCSIGKESTIVDVTGEKIKILRIGAIPPESL